jgi:hypothetical protein
MNTAEQVPSEQAVAKKKVFVCPSDPAELALCDSCQ